jgi:hypothetical protein
MLSHNKPSHHIRVCCVVDDEDFDASKVAFVQARCEELGLQYKLREYDSAKYSDDRHNITRLPAFHIYHKISYRATFYLTDPVTEIIDTHVERVKKKEEERRESIKTWASYFKIPRRSLKIVAYNSTEVVTPTVQTNPMHH